MARNPHLTPFTMYMSKELRHRIREAAAKHDQEMSPWVINAIESYLKFVESSLPRPNPRKGVKGTKRPGAAMKVETIEDVFVNKTTNQEKDNGQNNNGL